MATKRTPTTKDISLLQQLFKGGQLTLAAEFQRDSVWPPAAKAYLIDTILHDRPIPLLFFQRVVQPQSGRAAYAVVDGQQRLRAIFEFLDGRFGLSQTKEAPYRNKRFSKLPVEAQERILNYDLVIEEISGYSEADIRDVFVRLNKYLVKLSPQELRHAREVGRFKDFVERVAKWPVWTGDAIFTAGQVKRMRPAEFVAELTILLIEGPQDKKTSIDLYYGQYRETFQEGRELEKRLTTYFEWLHSALPNMASTRFRKPVDFYSLIGALDAISARDGSLRHLNPARVGAALTEFSRRTLVDEPDRDAARYVAAASRQTDNIGPRRTRIEIIEDVLRESSR